MDLYTVFNGEWLKSRVLMDLYMVFNGGYNKELMIN